MSKHSSENPGKPAMNQMTLSITVNDGAEAITFYEKALGAVELSRINMPDGALAHANLKIGETLVFLSGASPEWNAVPFEGNQTAPCLFCYHVEDVDAAYDKAVAAGAESIESPTDQIWGERTGIIRDPFGYRWCFHKTVEEMTPEQLQEKLDKMLG